MIQPGDRVRFTAAFVAADDGSGHVEHFKDKVGTVQVVCTHATGLRMATVQWPDLREFTYQDADLEKV